MSLDGYEIKRARGYIISGLGAYYPNGVSGGLIHRDMLTPVFPHLEWVKVLQQLDYLQERGYVEPIEGIGPLKSHSLRERLFRLTAKGYDLVCGIVQDAGIETEL